MNYREAIGGFPKIDIRGVYGLDQALEQYKSQSQNNIDDLEQMEKSKNQNQHNIM